MQTEANDYDIRTGKNARARAFHLLKKYTSLTFLNYAVDLYRNFLNAYERQLNIPSPNQKWLEETYTDCFLQRLIEFEQGLDSLRREGDKKSAYSKLIKGGGFSDYLWGMASDHWGINGDPFFEKLGLHSVGWGQVQSDVYRGFVKSILLTHDSLEALKCTVGFAFYCPLSSGKRADGGDRFFSHWTYESLFQERPSPLWPHWPPLRVYPADLPPCPEKNESNEGQVVSGEAIVLEGIYEPWFFTGGIGCPNYFLRGQTAHQYQPEGSNDLVPVRWRLLWEDRRYVDGTVPAEEAHYYVNVVAEISSSGRSVVSGDLCPQTGNWLAPRLNNRQEYVERGQPMPGPASTPTGSVVWYLQKD
ncbi:hypothetical protein GFK26_04420 [Variovorax paradoxus]|uniref:Immunity protein 72 domain-containing protein n=1 Tax=Variovorax paradoxus TaxID=34073 RepID=A0A5Q0LXZ4_VARPD|nr:Imm72 family immunity protein [Variovorax paradoxus]QFZ82049.1 hypothetical protein GFK26_04420 [Variovorax paradoxus]